MARRFLGLICTAVVLWIYLIDIVAAIQITGATGGVNLTTGERPSRQEINQFAASGPAYHLFILALRQLQSTNQSDPLSYFQIAGIHGYPRIPWDGVVGTGAYPGFCTHAAVAFPTWHRPYMALYEQVIWNNAQAIAVTYPTSVRDEYIAAATTLRIPYWDWAAQPWLPNAASQPNVTIDTPDGTATVSNPLYAYTFLDTPENEGIPPSDPMANMTETVRWWDADLRQSNQTAANASLLAQAPTILSLTYQIFTSNTDYSSFSCTWPAGRANSGNNIENIHNSIHNSVGGHGHMTYPEVAAFDPIFWLHHANVDRLFALWQALNPDSYIVPTLNAYGSYYELPNTFVESGNSSLAPFHSDNGTTMYTSDDVRSTLRFGYTYPELPDWNISATQLASNVRSEINLLYNPNVFATNTSKTVKATPLIKATIPVEASNNKVALNNAGKTFNTITFKDAKNFGLNNLDMQWNIDVIVQRYAYDTAFAIDFFIGKPEPDPKLRPTAANLIGSHAQFVASDISLMFPNGPPQGLVHGHVSLSATLAAGLNRSVIRDLTPQNVVPLLSKELSWNARTPDGCDVDVSCLKNLSIIVSSRTVQPAIYGSEFPAYGQLHWWPTITLGKPGGKRLFNLRDREVSVGSM